MGQTMGMSIDNADKLLSVITSTITEDDDCFTIEDENLQVFKETLLTAIDTMRKYQKIEEIVNGWSRYRKGVSSSEGDSVYMQKVSEVVDNGKNVV